MDFSFIFSCVLILVLTWQPSDQYQPLPSVKHLNSENFTTVLSNYKLAIVNFYVDWCHFCHVLQPILEETARLTNRYQDNEVVLAKVNCDDDPELKNYFRISKYPTIKIIRNGVATQSEYRAQRTTRSLLDFIEKEMESPLIEFDSSPLKINVTESTMVGLFHSKQCPAYELFKRVCSTFRQFSMCSCYARVVSSDEHFVNFTHLSKGHTSQYEDEVDWDHLFEWFKKFCIPLVREITYENAEEITEEGKPLLILCHQHADTHSVHLFKQMVEDNLSEYHDNMSFVTADDFFYQKIFYNHLQLREEALPALRLDDFRHVYKLPSLENILKNPQLLIDAVKNFFLGKLHDDFHEGHAARCDKSSNYETNVPQVFPLLKPEAMSVFRNLTPSGLRYTILHREEL